jgi:hypothetical protein
MYMVLPQIEEEIALKEPGSAIVGTRRLRREVGISIVYLVIRFRGSKRANVHPALARNPHYRDEIQTSAFLFLLHSYI